MTIYIYLDSGQTVTATPRKEKGDDMTPADHVDKILEDIEFNGYVCLPDGKNFVLVNAKHISHIRVCAEWMMTKKKKTPTYNFTWAQIEEIKKKAIYEAWKKLIEADISRMEKSKEK